jgi:hypothetical protein
MEVLRELLRGSKARDVLEVGMANGSSTVSMLEILDETGGGHLTSIDPFQLHAADGESPGYGGEGVRNVERAGFAKMHTLIGLPDYLAMPKLFDEGRQFDFVFIDGYHSFDYAMVDFFFADLILRRGGMVVFHDTNRPTVHRVCEFIQANKPYRRVGPPLMLAQRSLTRRVVRRAAHLVSGRSAEFAERRTRWKSLGAFVKNADSMADENVLRGL